MEVTIRAAGIEDADGIAEVNVVSWRAAYVGLMPPDLLDALSVPRRAAGWREVLARDDDTDTAVAIDTTTSQVVGYVNVGRCRDDDVDQSTGELRAIYLRPECWQQGVGHQLHDAGLAVLAQRFTLATLWVLDTNTRARGFYERHGWRLDGAQRQEHRDDTALSEVRYRRTLTAQ